MEPIGVAPLVGIVGALAWTRRAFPCRTVLGHTALVIRTMNVAGDGADADTKGCGEIQKPIGEADPAPTTPVVSFEVAATEEKDVPE